MSGRGGGGSERSLSGLSGLSGLSDLSGLSSTRTGGRSTRSTRGTGRGDLGAGNNNSGRVLGQLTGRRNGGSESEALSVSFRASGRSTSPSRQSTARAIGGAAGASGRRPGGAGAAGSGEHTDRTTTGAQGTLVTMSHSHTPDTSSRSHHNHNQAKHTHTHTHTPLSSSRSTSRSKHSLLSNRSSSRDHPLHSPQPLTAARDHKTPTGFGSAVLDEDLAAKLHSKSKSKGDGGGIKRRGYVVTNRDGIMMEPMLVQKQSTTKKLVESTEQRGSGSTLEVDIIYIYMYV